MKQFYYEQNRQKTGPVTIDELKSLQISGETLIWHEGLSDWTKAKEISELADYLKKNPPPLPSKRQINIDNTYDLTYEKEMDVVIAGIVLLLSPFVLKLIGVFSFDNDQSLRTAQIVLALTTLIIRITITFWVNSIAKRQNRNTTSWGFFTFFFPSIALISIGLLRRLKIEGEPSFAEIKNKFEVDKRTEEQKKIDVEKFKRYDKNLKVIIFTIIIGGFVSLFAMMLFWT